MRNTISKILFTYYHDKKNMPETMKKNWEDWKQSHPDFECILFDDEEAKHYLDTYFDEEIVHCFNILKPQSFKSDVFRYAYLYNRGGIYIDIKYKRINGFTFHPIIETNHDYFVKERLGIQNCLMISHPGHPVFLYTLNQIKEHCKRKTYGKQDQDPFVVCLSITGPVLLSHIYFTYFLGNEKYGDLFAKKDVSALEKKITKHNDPFLNHVYYNALCHKDLEWRDRDNHKIYWKNQLILQQYETYRTDLSYKNSETRHYSQMFDDKDIYE